MILIQKMKNFNIDEASPTLWTFKKQSPKDAPPKFNGHWVDTTDEMSAELKDIVKQQLHQITEEKDYSLLAENNEASVLTITEAETHVGLMKDHITAELPRRKVRNVTTLFNCAFYVIKLVHNGEVFYAAKKTDTTWKSKTANNVVTAIFSDTQLELAHDDSFRVQKSIDFFGFDGNLAVRRKGNFESILNYKQAHQEDYIAMTADAKFLEIFDDLSPLTDFIGSNKIHLRRMSAIRQKGYYADVKFMENLRKSYKNYGLSINFDDEGRIVPTAETCRDIIAALLDHRLNSPFSGNIYDVPDATEV